MKTLLLTAFLLWGHLLAAQTTREVRFPGPDLQLVRLGPHAWMHVSYSNSPEFGRFGSNGLVWVSGDSAWLFDTPMTDRLTEQLCSFIMDSLNATLAAFVPNHWHDDCMGGLGYIHEKGIPSYAWKGTVETAGRKNLPLPGHSFSDSLVFNTPDGKIVCRYHGPAHTTDNIVAWFPSEKILFAGCMAKSIASRNLGNVADGEPDAYPATIRKVMQAYPEALIVVPGHGREGGPELLSHTLELALKFGRQP